MHARASILKQMISRNHIYYWHMMFPHQSPWQKNAGLPIHFSLKTPPIYLNYFKMHRKIMVFVEMRSWGYHAAVEKAEGVLWLQLARCTCGICQTVEDKVSSTLQEPEIHFWKNGQKHSHSWDLIAWDSKDDGLFCFLLKSGTLLLL